MIALALLVFCAAAALDVATVRYYQAVQVKRKHAAARWSIAMYAIGAIGFVSVVQVSLWLMVPECLGLYAGTWLAMRHDP